MLIYRLSRYWNRLAFAIISLGFILIWDYTGRNSYQLEDMEEHIAATAVIMCERKGQ